MARSSQRWSVLRLLIVGLFALAACTGAAAAAPTAAVSEVKAAGK